MSNLKVLIVCDSQVGMGKSIQQALESMKDIDLESGVEAKIHTIPSYAVLPTKPFNIIRDDKKNILSITPRWSAEMSTLAGQIIRKHIHIVKDIILRTDGERLWLTEDVELPIDEDKKPEDTPPVPPPAPKNKGGRQAAKK